MTKSKLASLAVVAGLGLLGAPGAYAQDDKARSWAASCAACHGTNGRSGGGSEVPTIAGRSKVELLDILQQFKEGKRTTATVMHQHAKGYSDAQLERIADYFSKQTR